MSNHLPAIQPPAFDAAAKLHALERRNLEKMIPSVTPVWGQLDAGPLLRVLGLADFWQVNPATSFEQQTDDLLAGLHGQGLSLVYFILGSPREVQVYVGLQDPTTSADGGLLRSALAGAFPGILLAPNLTDRLGASLKANPVFSQMGRLTGIPTRKKGKEIRRQGSEETRKLKDETSSTGYQLERLLRGMMGQTWAYLVRATPVPSIEIINKSQACFQDLNTVSSYVHWQHTRQIQAMKTIGPNYQEGISESQNHERKDFQAQYCLEILEREQDRLMLGRAIGMWQIAVTFCATDSLALQRLAALLRAVFAGSESVPDPIRTFICQPGHASSSGTDPFVTMLTSAELGALTQLPCEEFSGFRLTPYTQFDLDVPPPPAISALNVGKVLDSGRDTGNWFTVAYSDLAKHGLVAGVTGSGKTNTLFYLLDKLWREAHIPFLVIEPAKTEYRHLKAGPIPDLQIFTLGDERWAPFRLNPFEFEIADPTNRIHIQTHIDYLKAVFNAAFILYAPMPYVLDTCLHEIYQGRGWDLTTGHNRRLPPAQAGQHPLEYEYPVFPTLADLYRKIDEVVDRLGYDERIQMDVKAGLKARVGSLLLGSKGLMLGARHSFPTVKLLEKPTVLELEAIGNDDEKAFVIGLILTRLYEYRRVQAMTGGESPSLRHLAVFEEAHRLLKNVSTEVETEGANLKGQAVETFANMLSEIRAYGQGVLIAEQIPVKLAPDALKNTNLKLMHRLVAEDDRQALGATMNLDERQSRYVTSLSTGQAVAYAEGADRPYLIQVPAHAVKQHDGAKITNIQLSAVMQPALLDSRYDPAPGYSRYLRGKTGFDPHLRDLALELINLPAFWLYFRRYFLSAWLEPGQAVQGYGQLLQFIRQETANARLKPAELTQVVVAVILHALDILFAERGSSYNWLYNVAAALRDQASEALIAVAQGFDPAKPAALTQLATHVSAKLNNFAHGYRQQTERRDGPFAGCVVCQRRCLYRYDVAPLTTDKILEQSIVAAIRETGDDQAMWQALAALCQEAASRVAEIQDQVLLHEIALCFAAQMAAALNFGPTRERKLARSVQIKLVGQ